MSARKLTQADVEKMLLAHAAWIAGRVEGQQLALRHCSAVGLVFREADLSYADLSYADFRGANCKGVPFRHSLLDHANFRGVNCTEADLRWATLVDADFREADLTDVDFRNTTTRRLRVTGARVRIAGAVFIGSAP